MSDAPLHAHTLTEARLYLKVAECLVCGHGPLRRVDSFPAASAGIRRFTVKIACTRCRGEWDQSFDIAERTQRGTEPELSTINPTDDPSRVLDVGQWLVLASMIKEEAARESNKAHARSLRLDAERCLEEALKFYTDEGNDLPPPEALFCRTSRERFRESPERFSRHRIIGQMARLPHAYRDETPGHESAG